MRLYSVTLTGMTPLLMHNDNIEWADYMDEWKNDPANKKISKAGDDRNPAWRWIGYCYHDNKNIVIPQGNIFRAIMEGGAMVPVPGARSNKTFKAQTQSGMMSMEQYWQFYTQDGQQISWASIEELIKVTDFKEMRAQIKGLGFDLLVKRARIGTSKHIRVRPEFAQGWVAKGVIGVWDSQITDQTLHDILQYAGRYKGLCDWRPGSKTPGPYGMFEAEIIRQ